MIDWKAIYFLTKSIRRMSSGWLVSGHKTALYIDEIESYSFFAAAKPNDDDQVDEDDQGDSSVDQNG